MARALSLKQGLVGSHINYITSDIQMQLVGPGGPSPPFSSVSRRIYFASGPFGRGGTLLLAEASRGQQLDVFTLDMEAAPEAEICHQVGLNFMTSSLLRSNIEQFGVLIKNPSPIFVLV